jgi:hypothetical protein
VKYDILYNLTLYGAPTPRDGEGIYMSRTDLRYWQKLCKECRSLRPLPNLSAERYVRRIPGLTHKTWRRTRHVNDRYPQRLRRRQSSRYTEKATGQGYFQDCHVYGEIVYAFAFPSPVQLKNFVKISII